MKTNRKRVECDDVVKNEGSQTRDEDKRICDDELLDSVKTRRNI
jgi:hypothetical protein